MNGTHQIQRNMAGSHGLGNAEAIRDETGNPERGLCKGDITDHSLRSVISECVVCTETDPDTGIHEAKHRAGDIVHHVCAAVLQIAGIGFGSQCEIKHEAPPISILDGGPIHFRQGENERRTIAYQNVPDQARLFSEGKYADDPIQKAFFSGVVSKRKPPRSLKTSESSYK